MDPTGRRLFGVAAAFVAMAGLVWCALSIVITTAALGVGPTLAAELVRVGGPPALVALVAGAASAWARR